LWGRPHYSNSNPFATCHELVKRKKSGLEVVNPDKFEVFWGQIRPLGDRGKCAAWIDHAAHHRISAFRLGKLAALPRSFNTLLRSVLRASDAFPQLPGSAACVRDFARFWPWPFGLGPKSSIALAALEDNVKDHAPLSPTERAYYTISPIFPQTPQNDAECCERRRLFRENQNHRCWLHFPQHGALLMNSCVCSIFTTHQIV